MATKVNYIVDQGTDWSVTVDVTDDDGNLIDLTGFSGASKYRKHYASTNAANIAVTINTTSSQVTLSLNAANTANVVPGRYRHDCELTSPGGIISRLVEGIIEFTPSMTR